jgi:hypothetical protein
MRFEENQVLQHLKGRKMMFWSEKKSFKLEPGENELHLDFWVWGPCLSKLLTCSRLLHHLQTQQLGGGK